MGNFFSNYEETFQPDIPKNLRTLAGGNNKLSHFSEMTQNELTELSSPTSDINMTQQMEMNLLDNTTELSLNTNVLNQILETDNIQNGGGEDSESSVLVSTTNHPLDSSHSDINDLMQMGGYNSDSSNDGSSISISS